LDQLLNFVQHAAILIAIGLCAVAAFVALNPVRGRTTGARLGAAMLLGAATWAAPFLAAGWPASVSFHPVLLAASLTCTVGASFWALVVRDRSDGANLRIIGPGAILGAGAGLSHGAVLIAIVGANDAVFDDDAFCAGVAIASACGVLAFVFLSRGWRHAAMLAAAAFAIGTTACAALAGDALPAPSASPVASAVPIGVMAILAPCLVVASIVAAVWRRRASVRPATRASAWRGNRRPSRAPRRAETAFPHRALGQSIAARVANLGRPGQPAR
jgi:NO-binding membrane sensor protein with MHYT domain